MLPSMWLKELITKLKSKDNGEQLKHKSFVNVAEIYSSL